MGRRQVRSLGGEADVSEDGRLVVSEIAARPERRSSSSTGTTTSSRPTRSSSGERPVRAEVRGEWLYARGVADDKGQLWMQLEAIASLVREGPSP